VTIEQEIQLGDDLRHMVAGHSFQADPDLLLRRAQRARRRSLATRGVAGVGVLAVAAAGTAVGITAGGAGAGTPSVQDTAYVVKQVSAVLSNDSNSVYRTTDPSEGTVWYQDQVTMNEYWVDGTGTNRVEAWDSAPLIDHHVHLRDTTVNHKDRTYSTSDQQVGGYISGTSPKESSFVDRIKQGLGSGQDKLLGTGEYQGHQVIKLGYANDASKFQLWVDSTTYEPVRSVETGSDGQQNASDLAFLPRTPDLLHTMNTPQVPAGFTKVDDALPKGAGHGG
jgi:hypothetical protein